MTTAALIVAAGMSSRMGDFKPLLNIGSISIAQRVVATFQQAGVEKIVMVTGYNAVMLERHLAGNGVVFLRNENPALHRGHGASASGDGRASRLPRRGRGDRPPHADRGVAL